MINSQTTAWKTKFSDHALMRLDQRSKISSELLAEFLDRDKAVDLGFDIMKSRVSRLFFSPFDDKFFVVVQDMRNGFVVTILSVEYWHNLSKKNFKQKLSVSRKRLQEAVMLSDPENPLKYHPPILGRKSISFSGTIESEIGDIKNINLGSIEIDLFSKMDVVEVSVILKLRFRTKLKSRDISESSIIGINWGCGSECKINSLDCHGEINFVDLVESITFDLTQRYALEKKFSDYQEVFNRNYAINNR